MTMNLRKTIQDIYRRTCTQIWRNEPQSVTQVRRLCWSLVFLRIRSWDQPTRLRKRTSELSSKRLATQELPTPTSPGSSLGASSDQNLAPDPAPGIGSYPWSAEFSDSSSRTAPSLDLDHGPRGYPNRRGHQLMISKVSIRLVNSCSVLRNRRPSNTLRELIRSRVRTTVQNRVAIQWRISDSMLNKINQ